MSSLYALAACVVVMPGAAMAQQAPQADGASQADEIIVTAQRRQERARDVPISITAVSAEQLETANVNQLSDISRVAPAVRFDSAGTFVQPSIRGVGTAVTTSGGGPNVGIYVDGFYVANPESTSFDLMRTQSIQVLKGPQGTLFGRNTTGGAILVTTADPSEETAGEFRFTLGRFNAQTYQGYFTFGAGEGVAFDIEAQLRDGNSYFTNNLNNDDHVGAYRNWSIRSGMKLDISSDVSLLLRYQHSHTDDPTLQLANGYVDQGGTSGFLSRVPTAAYGTNSTTGRPLTYFFAPGSTVATQPGRVAINPTAPVAFTNDSDVYQATLRADLGFADMTSYTQYRSESAVNLGDLDATAIHLFNIYLGIENRTFSQELLFNSKPGGPLQWTAGLYYFSNRDTYIVRAAFGPAPPYNPFGGSSTTTHSYAGFVDMTYELTPSLFLTAGLRYGHDQVTDAYFNVPVVQTRVNVPDYNQNRVTPRVVLRYKPSEESSIYASYTRGYKAGILNVGGASLVPINPEDIDAFEVGYKYDDRILSVEVASFYYFYRNLQVSSFQSGQAQIRNAASSRIWGVEGSVRYRLSDAFEFNASAAYTHARYRSFANAPFYSYCDPTGGVAALACGPIGAGSLTQVTTDASGFQMQRSPDFTANAGFAYHMPLAGGNLTLSSNLYYTSKFYFDPSRQFVQGGHEVLAARAQWTDASERISVSVFGDNLTNQRYLQQVLFNTLGIGAVWSAPRTWGVSVGYRF